MVQSLPFYLAFCYRLAVRRWRLLTIIACLCIIPVLVVQWMMLQEQESNQSIGWRFWESRDRLSAHLIDNLASGGEHSRLSDSAKVNSNIAWWTGGTTNTPLPQELLRPASFCNMPIAKGEEGESALGKDWHLRSVYVFIRHGSRSPLSDEIYPDFAEPLNCSLRQLDSFRDSEFADFLKLLRDAVPAKSGPFKSMKVYPDSEVCQPGSLTAIGVLQQFALGHRLARAYPRLLQDLTLGNIHLRSTISERSYQSVHSFIRAFFIQRDSPFTYKQWHNQIDIEASPLSFCSSDFISSCTCPKLRLYHSSMLQHRRDMTQSNPQLSSITADLAQFFSLTSSPPSLGSLIDVVMAGVCGQAGILTDRKVCWKLLDSPKVPRCMARKLLQRLWQSEDILDQSIMKLKVTEKYSKLVMYPILSELVTRMGRFSDKDSDEDNIEPQLSLFSGHDRTLRMLLSSLGLQSLYHWPPFAARFVIELFTIKRNSYRGAEKSPSARFRILYNGADITNKLSFCSVAKYNNETTEKTKSLGCPFSLLVSHLKADFWAGFDTKDLRNECHS